jgi:hypothetical protein
MLLDTCVLQNLKIVMDAVEEEYMTDEAEEELLRRYPAPLGPELVALGDLVTVLESNGPPWVVSEASAISSELESVATRSALDSLRKAFSRGRWRPTAGDQVPVA